MPPSDTPPPLVVRPATLHDAAIIAEFNTRLAHETEGKQLDAVTVSAGVRSLLQDPRKGRYLVACLGEQVVGQMMHTYEWSDWRNGDIWWLQSVYVHPDFRARGVFRALYQHLLTEAQHDPHVVGLRLYVEEHNTRAQEAYIKLDLQPAGYTVMESMLRRQV